MTTQAPSPLDFDQLITRLNLTATTSSAIGWRTAYDRDIKALRPPDYTSILNCYEARRLSLEARARRRFNRRITTVETGSKADIIRLALRTGIEIFIFDHTCVLLDDDTLVRDGDGPHGEDVPLVPIGHALESEEFESACLQFTNETVNKLIGAIEPTREGQLYQPDNDHHGRVPTFAVAGVQGAQGYSEIYDAYVRRWVPITRLTRLLAANAYLTSSVLHSTGTTRTYPIIKETDGPQFWQLR
jgi:hypothetical protein